MGYKNSIKLRGAGFIKGEKFKVRWNHPSLSGSSGIQTFEVAALPSGSTVMGMHTKLVEVFSGTNNLTNLSASLGTFEDPDAYLVASDVELSSQSTGTWGAPGLGGFGVFFSGSTEPYVSAGGSVVLRMSGTQNLENLRAGRVDGVVYYIDPRDS